MEPRGSRPLTPAVAMHRLTPGEGGRLYRQAGTNCYFLPFFAVLRAGFAASFGFGLSSMMA